MPFSSQVFLEPSVLHFNSSNQTHDVCVRLAQAPLSPVALDLIVPKGWDGTPLAILSSMSLEFLPSDALTSADPPSPPSPVEPVEPNTEANYPSLPPTQHQPLSSPDLLANVTNSSSLQEECVTINLTEAAGTSFYIQSQIRWGSV